MVALICYMYMYLFIQGCTMFLFSSFKGGENTCMCTSILITLADIHVSACRYLKS